MAASEPLGAAPLKAVRSASEDAAQTAAAQTLSVMSLRFSTHPDDFIRLVGARVLANHVDVK